MFREGPMVGILAVSGVMGALAISLQATQSETIITPVIATGMQRHLANASTPKGPQVQTCKAFHDNMVVETGKGFEMQYKVLGGAGKKRYEACEKQYQSGQGLDTEAYKTECVGYVLYCLGGNILSNPSDTLRCKQPKPPNDKCIHGKGAANRDALKQAHYKGMLAAELGNATAERQREIVNNAGLDNATRTELDKAFKQGYDELGQQLKTEVETIKSLNERIGWELEHCSKGGQTAFAPLASGCPTADALIAERDAAVQRGDMLATQMKHLASAQTALQPPVVTAQAPVTPTYTPSSFSQTNTFGSAKTSGPDLPYNSGPVSDVAYYYYEPPTYTSSWGNFFYSFYNGFSSTFWRWLFGWW
jgi:hypothetical protein